MSAAAPALDLQDLHKSYGAIQALQGASLQVSPGEVFGLVGPNGAGKTTLIKAICGILKPDAGRVEVLGMEAVRQRYSVRQRLGYMPQTPSLYDDLSPVENLRFFGSAHRSHDLKERIKAVLEFVRLWERRDSPLYTFSGGMRQRTSLACALLHTPELLILDEPTAGVDPTLRQSFWQHFAELRDEGQTIFLSTNQMDEALRCDRVAVILGGKILIVETPEAIRQRGQTEVRLQLSQGERLERVRHYERQLPQLLGQYGLSSEVEAISIRRQSLEEVILSLIGGSDAA